MSENDRFSPLGGSGEPRRESVGPFAPGDRLAYPNRQQYAFGQDSRATGSTRFDPAHRDSVNPERQGNGSGMPSGVPAMPGGEPFRGQFGNQGPGAPSGTPSSGVSPGPAPQSSPAASPHTVNPAPSGTASQAGGAPTSQQTQEFPWTKWEEEQERKRKKERRRPSWAALVACMLAASLLGGALGFGIVNWRWGGARPAATQQQTGTDVTPVVDSTGEAADWVAVANAVGPSVVAIDANSDGGQSAGSGVIIDSSGYVLTNEHVVAGAAEIFVTLSDGRVFETELVGEDQATDLAVLEIINPPDDLTAATLGTSSDLTVGQPVAAIGNPLGLSSTVTTGIISALDRPVQTTNPGGQQNPGTAVVTNAVQIDAAVNPGNSGGPVFDAQGRVIGIASSIASLGPGIGGQVGSIGLGFAIPIDLAKMISAQLIENGVAEHAYLGVTIMDGIASYGGVNRHGAEVQTVQSDTPAALAGVRQGDTIVEINGRNVSSATALTGYVRQYASGEVVTLTLERRGELLDVDVTLATRPD